MSSFNMMGKRVKFSLLSNNYNKTHITHYLNCPFQFSKAGVNPMKEIWSSRLFKAKFLLQDCLPNVPWYKPVDRSCARHHQGLFRLRDRDNNFARKLNDQTNIGSRRLLRRPGMKNGANEQAYLGLYQNFNNELFFDTLIR